MKPSKWEARAGTAVVGLILVYALSLLLGLMSGGCVTETTVIEIEADSSSVPTFTGAAAVLVQEKCVGCHLDINPAAGIVLEFLEAPNTQAERATWSTDIAEGFAGITPLTDAEKALLYEYGTAPPVVVLPAVVYFTTIVPLPAPPLSWPGVQIEDGGTPGTGAGWYRDGNYIAVVNDRKTVHATTGVMVQPNAYWFPSAQHVEQRNFSIHGGMFHASDTAIVFGATRIEPPNRKAREYFEVQVDDHEWMFRYRDGDFTEEFFRGPWINNANVSKTEMLAFVVTTRDSGDGSTFVTIECGQGGVVVASWSGVVNQPIVGKVGVKDYAWRDTPARVWFEYAADVAPDEVSSVPE